MRPRLHGKRRTRKESAGHGKQLVRFRRPQRHPRRHRLYRIIQTTVATSLRDASRLARRIMPKSRNSTASRMVECYGAGSCFERLVRLERCEPGKASLNELAALIYYA